MPLTLASTSLAVASIPALFGFAPENSLVLITTLTNDDGSAVTGPLTRIDLTSFTGHADYCVRHFNRQCGDLPVSCVTGVVIRTVDEAVDGGNSLPLRADVDAVIQQLAEHGFVDVDLVHVPAVAEGARWRSYRDTDRTGVLPDPSTTPVAAAAVAAGHSIATSREALAGRFAPSPSPSAHVCSLASPTPSNPPPSTNAGIWPRTSAWPAPTPPSGPPRTVSCPPMRPTSSISPRPSPCPRSATPCSPYPTTRRTWPPRTWSCTCGATAAIPSRASSPP
jgi:hypothetical protein